jgi:hypothetical protein
MVLPASKNVTEFILLVTYVDKYITKSLVCNCWVVKLCNPPCTGASDGQKVRLSSSWNLQHVTEIYNEHNAQRYLHTIQQLWQLRSIKWRKFTESVRGPAQEAAMIHFKTLARKGTWKIAQLQSGQLVPQADTQRSCFRNTNQTLDVKKKHQQSTQVATKSEIEFSTSKCYSI